MYEFKVYDKYKSRDMTTITSNKDLKNSERDELD
ncbi:hypothetical protein ABH901_002916 [Mammaliicoccus lentus]|jgi:hypothetical protein